MPYHITYTRLPNSEGAGWLATVPDLPGCMSDGATIEEAEKNIQGAIASWIEEAEERGRAVRKETR